MRRNTVIGAVALFAACAAAAAAAGVVPSSAATSSRLQVRAQSPSAAESPDVRGFQAIVARRRPLLVFAFHPL